MVLGGRGDDAAEFKQLQQEMPPKLIQFQGHDYAYVTDTNGGNYPAGNPIIFDSLNMSLGDWLYNPDKSFVAIQHTVSATVGANIAQTAMIAYPKNGFPYLQSCLVQMDGKTMNNGSQMLHLHANYSTLSSWSQDKAEVFAACHLFVPDDLLAVSYAQTVANINTAVPPLDYHITYGGADDIEPHLSIYGNCAPALTATQTLFMSNIVTQGTVSFGAATASIPAGALAVGCPEPMGFATTAQPVALATTGESTGGLTLPVGYAGCTNGAQTAWAANNPVKLPGGLSSRWGTVPTQNKGGWKRCILANSPGNMQSHVNVTGANNSSLVTGLNTGDQVGTLAAAAAGVIASYWILYPLRVLCDFFGQCGDIRSRMQLFLTLNSVTGSNQQVNTDAFQTPAVVGNCCPIMLNRQYHNTLDIVAANAAYSVINVSTGIVGPTYLFLAIVKPSPEQSLQLAPKRYVEYEDFELYTLLNQTTNANNSIALTWTVTTGTVNPLKLIVYKFATAASYINSQIQGVTTSARGSPLMRFDAGEPAYSTPGINMGNNTQLLIGSKPLYQYPSQWYFLQFYQTVVMGLYMGGMDPIISEGLRSYSTYTMGGIDEWDLMSGQLTAEQINNTQIQLQTTVKTTHIGVDFYALVTRKRVAYVGLDGFVQVMN